MALKTLYRHMGELVDITQPAERRLVEASSIVKGHDGVFEIPDFVTCRVCGRPLWGVRSILLGVGPDCLIVEALRERRVLGG